MSQAQTLSAGKTGSNAWLEELARRREALMRDLTDARNELGEVKARYNRYEKLIEVPRLHEEIQRLEIELREIDNA